MADIIPKALRQELGNLIAWMEDHGAQINSAYGMARGGKLAPNPRWGYSHKRRGRAPEFTSADLAKRLVELYPQKDKIQRQLRGLGLSWHADIVGAGINKNGQVDLNKLLKGRNMAQLAALGRRQPNRPSSKRLVRRVVR